MREEGIGDDGDPFMDQRRRAEIRPETGKRRRHAIRFADQPDDARSYLCRCVSARTAKKPSGSGFRPSASGRRFPVGCRCSRCHHPIADRGIRASGAAPMRRARNRNRRPYGECGCRTREPRCRMPLRQTMSSAGSSGASPIHAGASMMLERFERGPLRDCGARFSISRHRSPDNGFSRRAPDASLSGGLCDDEREARCPA